MAKSTDAKLVQLQEKYASLASGLKDVLTALTSTSATLRDLKEENDELRTKLREKEAEHATLHRLVAERNSEIAIARGRVAQLDACLATKIKWAVNAESEDDAGRKSPIRQPPEERERCGPADADLRAALCGLYRQYMLREEHFASVERASSLETEFWRAKCALAEEHGSKQLGQVCKLQRETGMQRNCMRKLEERLSSHIDRDTAAESKLNQCKLLVKELRLATREAKDSECRRAAALAGKVAALSQERTGLLDQMRAAVVKNRKLEDLCRALQTRRKEQEKEKEEEQQPAVTRPNGIHAVSPRGDSFIRCCHHCSGKHDTAAAAGGPEPMPAILVRDGAQTHQVIVGESPRVIRVPRRRPSARASIDSSLSPPPSTLRIARCASLANSPVTGSRGSDDCGNQASLGEFGPMSDQTPPPCSDFTFSSPPVQPGLGMTFSHE
ncbi:hypothetical protein GQ54DRAFT_311429 [Martensiomyces pterosporus]|nr:hypothetical protein GQ54DRAFT_311429 [Martensiomyces pterosporus]